MTLEKLMAEIIVCFRKHAGSDGNSGTLSQQELSEMAKKEFPSLCQSPKKDEILKDIFAQMDIDGSNTVDFKEFMVFLSCITIAVEDCCKK
ncbi:hypothetical protein GDO78_014494 [Eleutherodactylus coqui]|uniref:EF-hand domain-containing protein n=1 Tax=Eleutherodactylus coqui TaxID=57060 RepID=A0A8J6B1D7_ELECQ|nr:hypothetical protein GDO78_014494 [Eleutherodactylus coqui]